VHDWRKRLMGRLLLLAILVVVLLAVWRLWLGKRR
jgi:hypothetical protein